MPTLYEPLPEWLQDSLTKRVEAELLRLRLGQAPGSDGLQFCYGLLCAVCMPCAHRLFPHFLDFSNFWTPV